MSYLGDIPLGGSVTLLFTTVNTSGVPISMTGTSEVVIYKDTLVSEVLSGITFTGDFDGRTGLHAVRVLTQAAPSFYTSGSMYSLILSSGFLASIGSISNYMLGNFSINARSALRPERPGVVLALTPSGEVGLNWARIANSTTAQALTLTTIQAVTSNVTVGTNNDKTAYGVNWAAITNQATAVNLSATTIQAVNSNVIVGINNDKTGYALSSAVTVGINNDKTGYALGIGGFIAGAAATDSFTDTAASTAYTSEIAIAIGNHEVEGIGHYTADQIGRLILSALAGVTDTGGVVFRTPDGTTIRITATVNASNERTAITLTP